MADVYLVTVLLSPFQLFVDKKTREQTLPNLNRFMVLNLQNFHFFKGFGKIQFCSKQINPCFDLVFEKKKPQAEGGDDKGGKDKKKGGDEKKGKEAAGKNQK